MISVLPQEPVPEWLANITEENISNQKFEIIKILKDSLYYPSCGSDGLPINSFAGSIRVSNRPSPGILQEGFKVRFLKKP